MKPIGILGGGQLARMIALAGYPLGLRCRVLDPSPDPPAASVAEHIRGEFDDPATLTRFAEGIRVATYELEHLPDVALNTVSHYADIRPGIQPIKVARDRLVEKDFITKAGVDTAKYTKIDGREDLNALLDEWNFPFVLKTRTHGYDGHGQFVIRSRKDAMDAIRELDGTPAIAEEFVEFDRELSIAVVRSTNGEFALYPIMENFHAAGILRWSVAPAPNMSSGLTDRADEIARALALALDYVGVLVVELFQVGEKLLVNEIAPRVHNSAHWTIEGSDTSQFENHLRAILGLPLGSTTALDGWVLFNLLGETPEMDRVLEVPGAHLHVYGKTPRPGRKLGHVNCRAVDPENARPRLQALLGLT